MTSPGSAARLAGIRLVAFDFDGVFTDNTVYVAQDGTESVRCWRSDGLGLRALESLGIALVILSTEANPVVAARATKLRVPCIQGLRDKLAELQRVAGEAGVRQEQVAYLGNDVNDAACLRWAGVPVVVADAHPAVVPLAAFKTLLPGGRGAVRELCDLIEEAHAGRAV